MQICWSQQFHVTQNQVCINLTSGELITMQIKTELNDESFSFVENKMIEAFG